MNDTIAIERVNGRDNAVALEKVLIGGNLASLSASERINYYTALCTSLGLNALSRPFEYLELQGKLTLYAKRDATDQLRKIHNVSINIVSRERIEDVYVVTARATMPGGRTDESIGAVTIGNAKGDALANALMKAETKSKRRVTLAIVGLGLLDETEIETISDARAISVETVQEPPPSAVNAAPPRIEARPATAKLPTHEQLWQRCVLLYDRAQGLNIACEEPPEEGNYAQLSAWGRAVHPLVLAAEKAIDAD